MSVSESSEICSMVESYLEPRQPKSYHLDVVPQGSRQDDDWWYILVRPDKEGVNAFDYARILAETEQELQDNENVKVLLVPVVPD